MRQRYWPLITYILTGPTLAVWLIAQHPLWALPLVLAAITAAVIVVDQLENSCRYASKAPIRHRREHEAS